LIINAGRPSFERRDKTCQCRTGSDGVFHGAIAGVSPDAAEEDDVDHP